MKDLVRRLGISLVIITHNLGIVARYADRVNVMYAAKLVEQGTADEVFLTPRHPYAIGLMRSVPRLDRPRGVRLETIEGLPPNLLAPPAGCRFADRCPYRIEICATEPPLLAVEPEHLSACHRASELPLAAATTAQAADQAVVADLSTQPNLLSVEHLAKHFTIPGRGFLGGDARIVRAVDDVSFAIARGETLGLVGESGCGKTTIGRVVLRLDDPTAGELRYDGHDLGRATGPEMKTLRRAIQVIFQDPFSSLNPRMTVGQIIGEPISVYRLETSAKRIKERVSNLLTQVGLFPYMAERYPHELSGGQRQRVGIARALALEPSFIICDEPVSALDVSIQGQIINLLEDLQRRYGLTFLFIAHDLAVVRHISHRVAVMYLGKIMELADRDAIYAAPQHPYTQALLDAAPVPDPLIERTRAPRALTGELPSPLNPPTGCVFHTRCPKAIDDCRRVVPELRETRPNHLAACIRL